MDRGNEVWTTIIKNIIIEFVGAGLTWGVLSVLNVFSWLDRILIAILLLFVILGVRILVWVNSYKSYYYRNSEINRNYSFINKTIHYHLNNKNELKFSIDCEVKSNIEQLEYIYNKNVWTGKEKNEDKRNEQNSKKRNYYPDKGLSSGIKDFIFDEESVGLWEKYKVQLDETVRKGKKYPIRFVWKNISNCDTSSPFVSTNTDILTEEIVFDVNLGKSYANTPLKLHIYRGMESDYELQPAINCSFDKQGRFKWKICKNPCSQQSTAVGCYESAIKQFRYYMITWHWKNDA